jgi:DNA-binding response OmpR family regulator
MRALVVEDDPGLRAALELGLEEEDVTVEAVATGEEAVAAAHAGSFDVISLDVMLPGRLNGFEVCQEVRRSRVDTPILLLTARDVVEDRVRGLEAGADDYLVKPFAFEEFLARLRALTRRHVSARSAVLTWRDLQLDTAGRLAAVGGEPLHLTNKEFVILEELLLHRQQLLSRDQIGERVWSYGYTSDSNLVEVYIARLRRKLTEAGLPNPIGTVRGVGYRLNPD